MKNVFDKIDELDNAAKVPALRAVVHSMMAKTIGALRQHLRNEQRLQRDEEKEEAGIAGLDQRNDADENERSVGDIANAMGFASNVSPMEQAQIFHSVYDWAHDALATINVSKWDAPLTLDGMLEFMVTKSQPLDKSLVKALSEAAGCGESDILKLHELQDMKDRENLKIMLPSIKVAFLGFQHHQSEGDGFDQLPVVAQHQLGIKVFESLGKAKDKVLTSVMRTRRMSDLGSIKLIEEGVDELKKWVADFEDVHANTIREAIENGSSIRTLEDVK